MNRKLCNLFNLYKYLPQEIERHRYISFDIFDTLIIRKCGTPQMIFKIVEEKFNRLHGTMLDDFPSKRERAEMTARKLTGKREITIDDIYRWMEERYGRAKAKELRRLEIETEIEESSRRDDILDLYDSIRSGKQLFLTSDMYLPSKVIYEILEKNGVKKPKELYLSSECNAMKTDGSLFQYLLNQQKCAPNCMLHIGDNLKSDFIMPKFKGIHSYIIDK